MAKGEFDVKPLEKMVLVDSKTIIIIVEQPKPNVYAFSVSNLR